MAIAFRVKITFNYVKEDIYEHNNYLVTYKRDNSPHLLRYEKNTIYIQNTWFNTNLSIGGSSTKAHPSGLFDQLSFSCRS